MIDAPSTPVPARRLLPIAILALIALDSFRPIANYDIHWHLAAGRIMLDRGEVLTTDPLSWTIQGKRWVNHEWLSQVLFALAERAGGLTGVRLLTSLVITLSFLILYVLAARRSKDPWVAGAVVGLGFVLYLFRVQERPHIWTPFLFFCVYGVLLREDLSACRKAAVAVVVAALWANLHAGALVTPLLLGAFAVGSLGVSRRDAATYAVAAALSAVAVCATPNGWAIWEFALTAQGQTHLVPEWRSPWSFDATEYAREKAIFVVITLVWLLSVARRPRDIDPRETLAALLGVVLAASAIRFLFFLALPTLQAARFVLPRRAAMVVLAACLAIVAFDQGERRSKYREAGIGRFDDLFYPHYPVKAVDYLSELQLSGRGAVHPGFAGYLSWRLWPRYLTFVDGRTPDFGNRLCEDAIRLTAPPGPDADMEALLRARERLLDEYGIDWVLAPRPYFGEDDRVYAGRWVPAYVDAVAVVYVRNDGPHAKENGDAVIEHARKRKGR
ncbi:MAG: hypothetical protein AAB434_08065 [Planctomycetota bacterium]